MIKGVEPITSADFNKGLVTRGDFLKGDINASPNTMDVQWRFDSVLQKRLGASSTNTTTLITSATTSGWTLDTNSSLSTSIKAWWKLDEASGSRIDQVGTNNLTDYNSVTSITGIRNQGALFVLANSQALSVGTADDLLMGQSNLSISAWFYMNSTAGATFDMAIADRGSTYRLDVARSTNIPQFTITSNGGGTIILTAASFGAITTSTWYNIVGWHSNNSHIGISVNLSVNTAAFTTGSATNNSTIFSVGCIGNDTGGATSKLFDGRIDEVGEWRKVLTSQERSDLYGGGSGNTYSGSGAGGTAFAWASFDFGASAIRWLTVAAGTGIYASSNRGATFVVIATTRTASYQYLDRSKNILVATSDQYDVPLYWAGSAGTFALTLAPNSAPGVKFNINYNGFLILLNSNLRKRGFFYADENTQLTDPWTTAFDFPSSADDEITSAFVLYKFLYVSTRYKIFRVSFVGGNPDWSYLKIKDWGFVPRTAQLVSLKGGGQVVIGLDWDRRLRMFDGFDDLFISDNVENNNGICDFAMNKISYAGSGLQIAHAILNPVTQEYRLNVAIGGASTQTTHGILLNARNLAFYPYSNQQWQTMCVAESNNQRALMAFDRSGFCYIMDSGNRDYGTVAIGEMYDTPPLFSKIPEVVSKGKQLNLFFAPKSSGVINYQSRVDLSNNWGTQIPLSNAKGETTITGTENLIKVLRTIDVKETYNTIQFRFTTSSGTIGTANPWELDRLDFLQQGFGVGKGN